MCGGRRKRVDKDDSPDVFLGNWVDVVLCSEKGLEALGNEVMSSEIQGWATCLKTIERPKIVVLCSD